MLNLSIDHRSMRSNKKISYTIHHNSGLCVVTLDIPKKGAVIAETFDWKVGVISHRILCAEQDTINRKSSKMLTPNCRCMQQSDFYGLNSLIAQHIVFCGGQ